MPCCFERRISDFLRPSDFGLRISSFRIFLAVSRIFVMDDFFQAKIDDDTLNPAVADCRPGLHVNRLEELLKQ